MTTRSARCVRPTLQLLFAACGWLAGSAVAQDGEANELPSAESILDRHVKATGGAEAHKALTSRKRTGTLAIDMAGHVFDAAIEEHALAPNHSHTVMNGEFFFQVSVSSGPHAWEWRPGQSHGEMPNEHDAGQTTMLEGVAKARALEAARFHGALEWRERVAKVETVGVASVRERPAYEVRVTNKRGEEFSQFYDQETGRLVKRDGTRELGHLGSAEMELYFEDYREFDGVWMAMRRHALFTFVDGATGTQTWTYATVEHDVEISPKLFELPEELRGERDGDAHPHRHGGQDEH